MTNIKHFHAEEEIQEQYGVYDSKTKKIISKHPNEASATVSARVTDVAHWHRTKKKGRYQVINLPHYIGKPAPKPKPKEPIKKKPMEVIVVKKPTVAKKKTVKEEILQELSNKTLGNYIKAAKNNVFYADLGTEYSDGPTRVDRAKRSQGINTAVNMLVNGQPKKKKKIDIPSWPSPFEKISNMKESIWLQELSKQTLGKYIKKASEDSAYKLQAGSDQTEKQDFVRAKKSLNTFFKRKKGIETAVDRIIKK